MAKREEGRGFNSSHLVSVLVAVVLLGASGAAYRAAAARFGRAPGGVVLERGTLNKLPLQIGDWVGVEVSMDEQIVRATDTDDHVNRTYVQRRRDRQVVLWIAYGIRLRDLMPHRPEVCYTSSGWSVDGTKAMDLAMEDGGTLPCRILRFQRGGLGSGDITVLNYYLVDGEYCADVSLLRSTQWRRGEEKVRYAAQIQIASSSGFGLEANEEAVRAFAVASAEAIRTVIAEEVAAALAKSRES
jgi:EpsI family protein